MTNVPDGNDIKCVILTFNMEHSAVTLNIPLLSRENTSTKHHKEIKTSKKNSI